MPENNQLLSVESQLVGLPLAGPESFSQQQLDYLKRALGFEWQDKTSEISDAPSGTLFYYNPGTNQCYLRIVTTKTLVQADNLICTLPEKYRPVNSNVFGYVCLTDTSAVRCYIATTGVVMVTPAAAKTNAGVRLTSTWIAGI